MDSLFNPPDMVFKIRSPLEYGDIKLSIQGSSYHYCSPRKYFEDLTRYESVEVGFIYKDKLTLPSKAGIQGFDHLFEDSIVPVAPYVPLYEVERLKDACKKVSKHKEREEKEDG